MRDRRPSRHVESQWVLRPALGRLAGLRRATHVLPLLPPESMTRVALVTGGGRGLGRAIALALAPAGCAVAVGARSRDAADAVAVEIRAMGVRGLAVVLDVTDPASIAAAVKTVGLELGPIDVLVNNAGIA